MPSYAARFIWLWAVALLVSAWAPAARAITITDGTTTVTVSDTHGGLTAYVVGGSDHLFQAHYYYRVAGFTQEERFLDSARHS